MDHFVEGKVVIITGGSSGFGIETARILLSMGAKVVITGRDEQRLRQAEDELNHENLLAVRADATSTEDWRRLIDQTRSTFGRIDVLVNNHGAGVKIAEVENLEDDDIQAILDINLTSVVKGCREVVRVMKQQGSGHIVNVSSAVPIIRGPRGLFTRRQKTACSDSRNASTWKWPSGAARPPHLCRGPRGPVSARQQEFRKTGWKVSRCREFARTLVHCVDVPDNCFIEETRIWGTKQVKEMLNPF